MQRLSLEKETSFSMNFQCNHGKFGAVDKDNTVAASAKKVTWNCKVDQVATDILIVQITFERCFNLLEID